ncbi:MAG: hypothetical protein FWD26_11400 [Treponema sp.]|nr:hypothetical protein [Treponema sp.]
MKKLTIALILMFVLAAGAFADTLYYQYVESVDRSTGVKSKMHYKDTYITFTRNSCYASDAKGLRINCPISGSNYVFNYQGEQNNLLIFRYSLKSVAAEVSITYAFSRDYSRINISIYNNMMASLNNHVHVYQRANPPSTTPDVFY